MCSRTKELAVILSENCHRGIEMTLYECSDLVKIDICLEKAVSQVSRTLIIYVSGHDKHEIVNYTSELYNLVWDVVCIHNKPHLDIR